jgi:hypothetical protein
MELRSDLVLQKVGDEALVLDLKTDQIHQFNATAAWILERINGSETTESLVKQFAKNFSVNRETALDDVNNLVCTLRKLSLLHGVD